jgi:hypothetical protein
LLGLLRQLHPRVAVIFGCAMLALAGMNGLLAWLGTLPPRDQLLHLTGQIQELKLQNPNTGAFTITLLSAGALHTFDFDNAHRLIGLPSSTETLGDGRGEITATLHYFEIGRGKKVVDVVLGKERVLSYDKVARLAAEKAIKDRNSAIGFGIMGAVLISVGGLARLARGNSHYPATPNSIGALLWLVFYGLLLMVMLTEPAILHRAFGTEAFHLPIEYALPVVLALLLLPLWPGCMGLTSLLRQAMRKGRGGKLGMIMEMRSALASDNPAERRMAMKSLWFVAYFGLLAGAWIAYAAMLGI